MPFSQLPSATTIESTIAALRNNNIEAFLVENRHEANRKLFELLPEKAEVMNMTSETLKAIDAVNEILESGEYHAVRNELNTLDRKTDDVKMRKLGSAPEWVVGSVHAVTEDGHVLIASMRGSQLPAYAYGSRRVIWVVGAQKIVKDIGEGMRRIYEHSLPLENERIKKSAGVSSAVNKILIFNREVTPGRVTMILVNEVLGF